MQAKYLAIFFISLLTLHIPLVEGVPVLKLDRATCTPFEKLIITLTDPSLNINSEVIESVHVTISGSAQSDRITLRETGPDTGIFQTEVKLTPDRTRYHGDVQVRRGDALTISYRVDTDTVITQTVQIQYHEATVSFDKSSYEITDIAMIRVTDRDANINPGFPDTVTVKIWSDTDNNGLTLSLRETGSNTGFFEESLLFTLTDPTSGNRLRVSDRDTISISYVDNTLPSPAKLSADGVTTLETKTVTATSLFGKHIPPTLRTTTAEPKLLNSLGEAVIHVRTGEQLMIQSEITNTQTKKQPFAYIVQVKDVKGITVSLSWITSELPPNESLRVAQSWLPLTPGNYTIEIFVWESLTSPMPLSASNITDIQILN